MFPPETIAMMGPPPALPVRAATADCRNDRRRVRGVLQNLKSERSMAGNEVVAVEGMHERAVHSGEGVLIERSPRDVVRNENELGAESLHALDLGRRCGLE